jgi:hypothetical protein
MFFDALIVVSALLGAYFGSQQWREGRFVRLTTLQVLEGVPENRRAQVTAIRDYLRSHVTFIGAPVTDRPFLRASAAQTLRSGKGFCGEVSRTFICMAGSVGINAQRISLYGPTRQHVVAEAELGLSEHVIVDAQNPPYVLDLEPLDEVIRRPDFNEYYTLNLRRLHVSWLVTRLKLHMGPFTYWTENPAALKSFFYFSLTALFLLLRAGRAVLRSVIVKRGWVHISDLEGGATDAHPDHVDPPVAPHQYFERLRANEERRLT